MSGIAGYLKIDSGSIKNSCQILNMLKVQKHRGPDDIGIRLFSLQYNDTEEILSQQPTDIKRNFEGILGFNRLNILDLSPSGHQPMTSPDGKVILVMNGLVYNAFNFKPELEKWGYSFKSTTDVEIILALYLKYGFKSMLLKLNGMFAIVLIDLGRKELYFARDRFGIKPFYYLLNTRILAFSSELKSFTQLEDFEFSLNKEKLDEYLLFRNNLKGTLLSGIEVLEPASYLVYRPTEGLLKQKYFDLNKYSRINREGNTDSFCLEVQDWLEKSVRSQLIGDVKIGGQLSGGIDSSLVTWLINKNIKYGNGKQDFFSVIFDNKFFNEEYYIDIVSNTLGITVHKTLLDHNAYLNNIERATWHIESPLNHPNSVGLFTLSQKAREFVTVLLSGEGADEVFGGYSRIYNVLNPYSWERLLRVINKNLTNPREILYYMNDSQRAIMAAAFMTPFYAGRLKRDFKRNSAIQDRLSLYESLSGSGFDKLIKYEFITYLPDLLIRQDKMLMAHSIESRMPFLDNNIVESSFTIPEDFLSGEIISGDVFTPKYLLKEIAAKIFGKNFAFRKKMGFGIPMAEFFSKSDFREYLNDLIIPGIQKRGLFSHRYVSRWKDAIPNLNYIELEAFWVMISFEIWASLYLDKGYEDRYS